MLVSACGRQDAGTETLGSAYDAGGRIADARGNPMPGVTVALSAGYEPVLTDANGEWAARQLRGAVTATPRADGWSFAPDHAALEEGEGSADFDMRLATPLEAPLVFVRAVGGQDEVHLLHENGVVERVTTSPGVDQDPALSPDGTQLAFVSSRNGSSRATHVMPLDGSASPTLVGEDFDRTPAWSPDGTRLAVSSSDGGNADVSVMDADGGQRQNLTQSQRNEADPAWSPDGDRLAFVAFVAAASQYDVHVMDADGRNETVVTDDAAYELGLDWSWSHDEMAYGAFASGENQVRTVDPRGGAAVRVGDVDGGAPSWSPSGDHIAYTRFDTGEVHLMDADGGGDVRLTFGGGADADW